MPAYRYNHGSQEIENDKDDKCDNISIVPINEGNIYRNLYRLKTYNLEN